MHVHTYPQYYRVVVRQQQTAFVSQKQQQGKQEPAFYKLRLGIPNKKLLILAKPQTRPSTTTCDDVYGVDTSVIPTSSHDTIGFTSTTNLGGHPETFKFTHRRRSRRPTLSTTLSQTNHRCATESKVAGSLFGRGLIAIKKCSLLPAQPMTSCPIR